MGRWQNEANWPIIKPPAEQGWAPLPVKGNLRAFPRQGKQDLSNTGSQGPRWFLSAKTNFKVHTFVWYFCFQGLWKIFCRGDMFWLLTFFLCLNLDVTHAP